MLTALAAIAFAASALLATGAIASTWNRYGLAALGRVAALREVSDERSFHVRISGTSRPALAGHPGIRRLPHRTAATRPVVRWLDAPRVAA